MQNIFWNNRIYSLQKRLIELPIHLKGVERRVPFCGFIPVEQIKRGEWAAARPVPVIICASRAQSGGVWFQVRQGIQGLLLRDAQGKPAVYILTAPSTHYFKTMTGATRMPVLVDQVI